MNEVINAIKSRRSVRKYKQEQIKKEYLDAILEAGIYAPTAHNEQPWHFTVIQKQELLIEINETVREKMAKSDIEWIKKMGSNPKFLVTYNAPTLIVVSGRINGMASKVDCSAAIQNMILAAESLNVGSVWLGLMGFFFNEAAVSKLEIPEGYQPYYGVSLGYKANEFEQVAPRRNHAVVNYVK